MAATTTLPGLAAAAPARVRDRGATRILGAALALGVGFDLLFYDQALGISAPIFVGLLVGALFVLGRLADVRPAARNLWLIPPLLFFAAMIAVHSSATLTLLNLLACLGLLGLLAYFYAAGRADTLPLLGYPLVVLVTLANALARPAPLIPAGVSLAGARRTPVLPVLRGLVLAAPVLALFAGLLASADLVFAQYLRALLQLDFLNDLAALPLHLVVITSVAWLLAGGVVYALHRARDSAMEDGLAGALASAGQVCRIGFVEVTTLLVLLDGLFLAFGWVQCAYFFGGRANITVNGFTYAEYARRGFFELVAVAVLTLGLGMGLQALTRRGAGRQAGVFNGLISLMIGLVLVFLASALQRMFLYEEAYGYTELRLYVHVFMIWMAITLGWFVITLWVRPARFTVGLVLAALGFLATMNGINPEMTIAEQNLARYYATGKLDADYLAGLSEDAVPMLLTALDRVGTEDSRILRESLGPRLTYLETNPGARTLPAVHLARARAYTLLVENRDKLRWPGRGW